MCATNDAGLGHGTNGSPQGTLEEQNYSTIITENEAKSNVLQPPQYKPSPKHDPKSGWGSKNPIKTNLEGQHLLETGVKHGKQIYNITSEGKLVKFQPDNTPENGYHAYEVTKPRDIPAAVLKEMLSQGKITRPQYTKLRKGEALNG